MLYAVSYFDKDGNRFNDEPCELGSAINSYAVYRHMGWDVMMDDENGNRICDWLE